MLHALSLAFVDSVNVLLIGVLVTLALILGPGQYRRIAPLVLIGDWLGVLVLAFAVMLVFDGLQSVVDAVISSPLFGILLILTGLLTAFLTWRGGDSSDLVDKILTPLRAPSPLTLLVGFVLGVVQSATSVPFYAGLAVLSAADIPLTERYLGVVLYATVALSLPLLAGLALVVVRARPHWWIGRVFAYGRRNREVVIRYAGWFVTVLLIVIGVLQILG
ncbi:membrane protein [Gordonia sihwensis]|uniref:membrane protein n=1 Tax=Gordonia sihwensis TaxID=173559 RepID=UPI0005EDD50B|nr:membrane protein [Gordonia sihwensis]KJR04885.1 membrane protein [Gordonia sihwensis]